MHGMLGLNRPRRIGRRPSARRRSSCTWPMGTRSGSRSLIGDSTRAVGSSISPTRRRGGSIWCARVQRGCRSRFWQPRRPSRRSPGRARDARRTLIVAEVGRGVQHTPSAWGPACASQRTLRGPARLPRLGQDQLKGGLDRPPGWPPPPQRNRPPLTRAAPRPPIHAATPTRCPVSATRPSWGQAGAHHQGKKGTYHDGSGLHE